MSPAALDAGASQCQRASPRCLRVAGANQQSSSRIRAGTDKPTAAVPACLAVGCVCAALIGHLMSASARAVGDTRLLWMSAGVTVAFAGLVATLLSQPNLTPHDVPVHAQPGRGLQRRPVRHLAPRAADRRPDRRRRRAHPPARAVRVRRRWDRAAAVGVVVRRPARRSRGRRRQLPRDRAHDRRADRRRPDRRRVRVVEARRGRADLGRDVRDLPARPVRDSTRSRTCSRHSPTTAPGGRASRSAPASSPCRPWACVRLHRRRRPAARPAGRARPRPRRASASAPRREEELASLSRRRRERERRAHRPADRRRWASASRCSRSSTSTAGASSAPRRSRASRTRTASRCRPSRRSWTPTRSASGSSSSWRSSSSRAARREPDAEGLYLALNVSPAVLVPRRRCTRSSRGTTTTGRSWSSSPSTSRSRTTCSSTKRSARLRDHGVRVAVDDVGSGFASFRHVTRVNPEILKLDRSLVSGIDEDPVRQSLAAAIVGFAREVGAIVVSEGIESAGRAVLPGRPRGRLRPGLLPGAPGVGSGRGTRAGNRRRLAHTPGDMTIVDCAVYEDGCRRAGELPFDRGRRGGAAGRARSCGSASTSRPRRSSTPSAASSTCTSWPSRTRSTRTSGRRSSCTATRC